MVGKTTSRNTPKGRSATPDNPYQALVQMRAEAFKEGERNTEKQYEAYVLWSRTMSLKEARQQLGDDFYNKYLIAGSDVDNDSRVVESVLWVEDISDFYPMPSNKGLKLLKKLQKLEVPVSTDADLKKRKSAKDKAANQSFTGAEIAEIKKALLKIRRFPRGFQLVKSQKPHPTVGEKGSDKKAVTFPYSYDYSLGLIK